MGHPKLQKRALVAISIGTEIMVRAERAGATRTHARSVQARHTCGARRLETAEQANQPRNQHNRSMLTPHCRRVPKCAWIAQQHKHPRSQRAASDIALTEPHGTCRRARGARCREGLCKKPIPAVRLLPIGPHERPRLADSFSRLGQARGAPRYGRCRCTPCTDMSVGAQRPHPLPRCVSECYTFSAPYTEVPTTCPHRHLGYSRDVHTGGARANKCAPPVARNATT